MNARSQARVLELAPPVRSLALTLCQRLVDAYGVDIEIVQGLRSSAVQRAYWLQGRADLTLVNNLRREVGLAAISAAENYVTVTNAPEGHSYHEFGLAFDACPFDQNGNPDWNESHAAWQELIDMGRTLGLDCGADWEHKDNPHFQYVGRFPRSPNDEVREIYKAGGLQGVWDAAFGRET